MNSIHEQVTDKALRAFDAAVRLGSFTAAAHELGVSQSAVSHAIAKLESALGYAVVERTRSGVVSTPLGRVLHDRVSGPLTEISHAVAEARQPQSSGTVSLSVSTSLASFWLLPRLSDFKSQHPNVELRLVTTDSDEAVGLDDADLWIPLGRAERRGLVETLFCQEELVPVASPDLAATLGVDGEIDLACAPLLALEERYIPRFDWERWFREHNLPAAPVAIAYKTNDYSLVLQAALDGQGVALGWVHIVQSLIDDGRLIPLADPIRTDQPFQILNRANRPLSPGAEALRNWLQSSVL